MFFYNNHDADDKLRGDIENFIKDSNSVSYEKKYKLAVATLFLHYLLTQLSHIKIKAEA
ncbi:HTH domain-containing protein [Clostridium luticellarii]|uniref:Uncharacterized protein n=1 Tax=Clostridium luticellarii TaxID=1691940 RepID=A0A2T0B4X8_9CLOT|nr:HTH domain-containing protein [Clostridium luticellarii]PRR78863.1 hypothetical protein CLLU_35880 [Clostridium luticellarii]